VTKRELNFNAMAGTQSKKEKELRGPCGKPAARLDRSLTCGWHPSNTETHEENFAAGAVVEEKKKHPSLGSRTRTHHIILLAYSNGKGVELPYNHPTLSSGTDYT